MKNLLIKYLSPYFPCFIDSPVIISNNQPLPVKDSISEIISTQPISPVSPLSPLSYLDDSFTPKEGEIEILRDLLLVNKPDIYNTMVKDFIDYHGIDSEKVLRLKIPEDSLLDRDYNIHTITGSSPNGNELILRELRYKESLMSMSDNIPTIPNTPTPSIISVSSTVDVPATELDITSLPDIINYSATAFGG